MNLELFTEVIQNLSIKDLIKAINKTEGATLEDFLDKLEYLPLEGA